MLTIFTLVLLNTDQISSLVESHTIRKTDGAYICDFGPLPPRSLVDVYLASFSLTAWECDN